MSTEAHKRASRKWMENNLRRIYLAVPNDYFANVFEPFVKEHGYTMRGFVLEAINYYMKHITEEEKGD